MKFMMLLKADKITEEGRLPSRDELERMGKYNQELIDAGVLVDGGGLHPTSKGVRLRFMDGEVVVTDGPFAESKDLIAGYWMIQVASRDEAIAWARKAPFAMLPHDGRPAEIELRQLYELEDFPDVPADVARMEASFASNRSQK